ncbi:type I restriction-modification system subunit M [Mucilaginibacter gotjawali]|uniref:site-specific DNA-methyltransferase (adenine-specific) n=2 Tax=Mucilaginibacter gotjawali TaxID=1550579 RepID=A0A110B415_9SPHI|nr:class I SAM-dependent DNA methyltransferase [Mucilaginibacter gotjawali]MBB3055286.1 type I restriction enzyme M protein [Mucilaginibacter gotjawali]BAU56095.1 putative type I restriction enzymeP M protein [Mucilaginibacter gotjawali]
MTAEQIKELEDSLWQAADKLRVDSGLKASEYATPILGLIFLRFASIKYNKVKKDIEAELEAQKSSRMQREKHEIAIDKYGFYLPPEAEYDYLLNLPEKEDIAKAIKVAMEKVELYKPELKDSLPKDEYFKLVNDQDKTLPKTLLKYFKDIPEDATGDVFGKVYEYFLAEFALAEGQGGGEFFTPTSVVKLMVEIIEPYRGKILDPACGSGGMFVQSSYFIDRRKEELHDTDNKDLFVCGVERTPETVKLARMNLAVNGLRGEIKPANSYYDDPFDSYQNFDFVMANPPFNVDDVNLDRVKAQKRFSEYGIPQNKTKSSAKKKEKEVDTVPNANYLWINLFATSLKPEGRAALVMANSASDARNSEADIRKNLIKAGVIDCMLTLPKNMFYTVTLPATLWFFDKSKAGSEPKVLFIDARNIFRQVTRALREFTEEHIQNIATIMRLHRGETERLTQLLESYQQKAEDYEVKANALEPSVNEAVAEYDDAKLVWDEIQDRITTGKGEAKQLKNELGKAGTALTKAQKAKEELEKEYKALTDKVAYFNGHINWLNERFPNGVYDDVIGLCKSASLKDIEEQDYSLNPGRYVGVVIDEDGLTEEEFLSEMKGRHKTLTILNAKARDLENSIESSFNILSL